MFMGVETGKVATVDWLRRTFGAGWDLHGPCSGVYAAMGHYRMVRYLIETGVVEPGSTIFDNMLQEASGEIRSYLNSVHYRRHQALLPPSPTRSEDDDFLAKMIQWGLDNAL